MIRALFYLAIGVAAYHFAAAPTADLLLERMLHMEQVINTL